MLDQPNEKRPFQRNGNGGLVVEDLQNLTFQVHRKVFVSPEILEDENRAIFDKCWVYVGHASEMKNPGDFRTRHVAGRPVIFCRDRKGEVRALFNVCRHRGALVCREREGNTRQFQCIYHGWTYNTDGSVKGIPGDDAYPPGYDKQGKSLTPVARLEHYKDFYFANLDPNAVDLHTYLAGAKDYIDLVVDQSPSGRMEIISGTQEYDIKANWKLLVENSVDDYHLVTTHSTWLNYMRNSGVNVTPTKGHMLPTKGFGKDLGNGHLTTDNPNYRGRPVARWISVYRRGGQGRHRRDPRRAGRAARRGAGGARRRHQPQPLHLPQSGHQRRLLGDGAPLHAGRARLDARHRLGARPGRGNRGAARPPAACVPDVLRPRRLRHARRRRGAGTGAAGLCRLARGAVDRPVARHGLEPGAARDRRGASARVLAQVGRDDGAAGMNKPLDPAATVTRAEVEDFLYHEADLLDSWRLDEWLGLLTDSAEYYVPPNDKPDGDHRFTLFTVADDIVRLRERVIRLKDPNCHAEYPPSHTRRLITNVRITGMEGDLILVAANFAIFRHRRNEPRRASSSAATATSSSAPIRASRFRNAAPSSTPRSWGLWAR